MQRGLSLIGAGSTNMPVERDGDHCGTGIHGLQWTPAFMTRGLLHDGDYHRHSATLN